MTIGRTDQERQAPPEKQKRPEYTAWDVLRENRDSFGPWRTQPQGFERRKADDGEDEAETGQELPRMDTVDIVAFIIAFFQLLLPPFLIMAGVLVLLYFLIRLWAGV